MPEQADLPYHGTLEEQIAAFKVQMAAMAPPEVVASINQNIDEVIKSGDCGAESEGGRARSRFHPA